MTVAADDSVAVVVLTGAGRAFCPGADLKHFTSDDGEPDHVLTAADFDVPVLLHTMPQVTIAAINGACAGAGLGWACAADLRYAVADAKLNTAFLDVAVAGDMGLPWSLPRLIGAGRARELSLLPRKVTGAEAAAMGLVNEAFDDIDALRAAVAERAARLAGLRPARPPSDEGALRRRRDDDVRRARGARDRRPPAHHEIRRLRRSLPGLRRQAAAGVPRTLMLDT